MSVLQCCQSNRMPGKEMVNHQCDEMSFPVRPFASAWFFTAPEAPMVRLCANNQNKIGPVQPVEHPARPAFFRRPGNVLIELGVNAVVAEPLGQSQHTFLMLSRVMAVAL